MQQRFDLSPQRRRIVFSARMMRVKRPDLALDAFMAIADERPDWDLIMLGEGELRTALEARVPQRLRERVRWFGFLNNREEVASLYAMCDVLLLTSEHEPWGVVVVEAVAAGMAVIASDVVGAVPELVHDGRNGFVFPSTDLPELVASLKKITDEATLLRAKSQSLNVLDDWRADSDPVSSFRSALTVIGINVLPASLNAAMDGCQLPANYGSLALAGNSGTALSDSYQRNRL
jgi:glycosyltransferase involved in cell wall biosynthesis